MNDKLTLELDRISNLAGTLRRSMELQHLDRTSSSLPDIALVDHIEKSLVAIYEMDGDDDEYLNVDLPIDPR